MSRKGGKKRAETEANDNPARLGYVILYAKDTKGTANFFTDLLGFPVKTTYGDDWIEIDTGATVLSVHKADKAVSAEVCFPDLGHAYGCGSLRKEMFRVVQYR